MAVDWDHVSRQEDNAVFVGIHFMFLPPFTIADDIAIGSLKEKIYFAEKITTPVEIDLHFAGASQ